MSPTRSPKLDLLAVAAHPDDAELACGGTLAGAARCGYRVGVLDLTQGEMATRGTPATRAREAARAARALGLAHRENLGLPDSALEATLKNKRLVAARLRALRPRVLILPYWEGRHPDHVSACRLGYEASWLAGLKRLELPEASRPHRPFKILYSTLYDETGRVPPTFIVDITRDYQRRARAIACYRSQFTGPKFHRGIHIPLTGLEERLEVACRFYGELIGVRYGEPFVTREFPAVDDVLRLKPRSI
jgi:bacillithiol biosynthesis deacetylase BshB1